MPLFEHVAGREKQLLDKNLGETLTPETIRTLVIGTAERGPSNYFYVVTDQSQARTTFGDDGNLIQGMYEATDGGAPTTVLYRVGGTAADITGVGTALTITTLYKYTDAGLEHKVAWTADSILYVWRVNSDGTEVLIYQCDYSGTAPFVPSVDFQEVYVEVDGTIDTDNVFGDEDGGYYFYELDEGASGTGISGVTYTAGDSESTPTLRRMYELLYEAYYYLYDEVFDYVVAMGVSLDDANIADTPSLAGGGTDYLQYLKVAEDSDGDFVYTWADTLVDDDYHEVNFAYQLANFCYQMTRNELMCHGSIGVNPPDSMTNQAVVKNWIGKLPSYNALDSSVIESNGAGLLGNKFMSGTTTTSPGFWATQTEWLDDPSVVLDRNQVEVDIGRHLSVFSDWLFFMNRYAAIVNPDQYSYIDTGAATYCGFISMLDPRDAPTNNVLPNQLKPPYKRALTKTNDLAGARYVALRPRPGGHRIARAPTAARPDSDYKEFSTFAIVKRVDDKVRGIILEYIGKSMNTYKREALATQLMEEGKTLRKDGFIQGTFEFKPVASPVMAAQGQLFLFSSYVPAFELIRVTDITSLKLM